VTTRSAFGDADKTPAIRWLRAYSPAQIWLCDEVKSVWHHIMREQADSGHAYPLHVRGRHRCFQFGTTQEGQSVTFHVIARTLSLDYTLQVYRRALQHVAARYPGWNAHRYVSGPLVGERRIEWLDPAFPFGWSKLESYIGRIVNEGGLTARQSVCVDPCDNWGRLPGEPIAFESHGGSVRHVLVRICVDAEVLGDELVRDWTAILKEGGLPEIAGAEKVFTYQEVKDNLAVVSDAEIALINRADAREPLTDADRALFLACERLDEAAIKEAIASGANCNVINALEVTPLYVFVVASSVNRSALYENEDGDQMTYSGGPPVPLTERDELRILQLLLRHGAHPDLAGLDELTPVAQAALMCCPHIVKALCEAGADTGIHSFSDRSFGEWPDAWDYAVTDGGLYGGLYHQVVAELERTPVTPYDEEEAASPVEDEVPPGECGDAEEAPLCPDGPLQKLVLRPAEVAWLQSLTDPRLGEALLRYARAFNLLDASWLVDAIADEASYDSQQVFETLRGRAKIARYLGGKITTLQREVASTKVRMELGRHQALGWCALARAAAATRPSFVVFLIIQFEAEQLGAELVGGRSQKALGLDAGLAGGVEADEVECDVAYQREIVGDVSGAGAGVVVIELNIEAPVQAILDFPVTAHGVGDFFRVGREAADVVAPLHCPFAADDARALDDSKALDVAPLFVLVQTLAHVESLTAANLLAAVPTRTRLARARSGERAAHARVGEQDRIEQLGLVVFDAQHVVSALVANLPGNGGLGAHRVDGHDAVGDVERGKQLGNGGDFVGFLGGRGLAEHDPHLRSKGTHHVQRRGRRLARGASARLAVDRDDLLVRERRNHGAHPAAKDPLELVRIEQGKDPLEGVRRGYPVVEFEEPAQPIEFGPAPLRDLLEVVGAAQDCAHRHREQFAQPMPRLLRIAPVLEPLEYLDHCRHLVCFHRSPKKQGNYTKQVRVNRGRASA
jgi:hypothetical protein